MKLLVFLVPIALGGWWATSSVQTPSPPAAKPAAETTTAPLLFPTFEPFKEARLFRMLGPKPTEIDLDEQLKMQHGIAESMEAGREAGEKYGEPRPKTDGAFLLPRIDDDVRVRYTLVPVAMMKLEPLWNSTTWAKEQVDLATSVATYLEALPGAPKCPFVEAKPAENQAQLEKLVRWFNAQVAKPELYAAMFITVDDGPFAGLPVEKREIMPAKSKVVLDADAKLELHACQDPTLPEPWILQLVKDDKLVWSRILSGSPRGSVADVEFVPGARHWDAYGWKTALKVNWTYGKERCYLYLGPKGELLFYFLTW